MAASSTLSSLLQKWLGDVPGLDDDDWMEIWDFPFSSLASARDKMVQYKILHRAYYTPHRLHRMSAAHSTSCWLCTHQPAEFFHIFWSCPIIQQYWQKVLTVMKSVTQIPCDPRYCLLGLVEQLSVTVARRILINLLLFYARKVITMNWKKSSPHSIQCWRGLINASLPLYKATYANRGCPNKLNKVWACWLGDSSTTSSESNNMS